MTALTTIQPAKADIIRMIESNPKLADSTKAQYKKAISNYLDTGNSLADSEAIGRYAQTLSNSSKAFLKSAIRLWTQRVALQAKGQSTPETVNAVTATLHRLEAINESIQIKANKGQKAHTWLTQSEVKQLLYHCDDTITGKRDRVVLSLLLGAGLRRSELSSLSFDCIKIQGDRTVLEVTGKGAKDRVIPVSDRLAQLLTEWQQIAGDGYIARSLGMNRELGDSRVGSIPTRKTTAKPTSICRDRTRWSNRAPFFSI